MSYNSQDLPSTPVSFEDFNLSPFALEFVHQYFQSKNATEAVKKAGSTAKRPEAVASNLMKQPNVAAAIAWGMQRRVEAAAVDSKEVIAMLKRVYDKAMENGKYNDANKAAELLGNHLGMFRTANIAEAKIRSEAHRTSDDPKDVQRDISRFLKMVKSAKDG